MNKMFVDSTTYYSSSSILFMDTWMVFYWVWWIIWVLFVGMFYVKILCGCIIRLFILVGMFVLMFLGFFVIFVFGSFGIRM